MSTTIHFMFNMHPHYHCVTFDRPYEAITVEIILDEAHKAHKSTHVLAAEPEAQRENFQLRYIAEEKEAFSLAGLSDHDAILAKANDWYNNKGHFLDSSTRIGPDDSALLETVVPTPDSSVVRLYAIVAADVFPVLSDAQTPPLLAKRRTFIEKSQALLASGEDIEMPPSEDDPSKSTPDHPHHDLDLGSWATAYEPVFALATLALEGRLGVEPDVRAVDENFEVIDGNAFDIRICVYDLRQVLRDVQYSPDSNNVEELKGLLRDLFDDPTLQVNVELATGEDGNVYAELEIIGECETAHGLPALYIMGKDKLIPDRWQMHVHEPEGFVAYRRAVVGPKYAGVREMTCCPCLIIEMCGYSVRIHAAYFSDDVHCTQLCDILLLHPSWPDGYTGEYSNTFQLQVVRKTAQELRRAYARVHTGSALPGAPHLFPQFERLICPSLPCPLTLVDRVPPVDPPAPWPVGWSVPRAPLLFTGFVGRDDGSLGPVHVKFTSDRKYGVAAHLLLAKYRPGRCSDSEAPQAQDSSDSDADADWDSYCPLAPAFLHGELWPGTDTRLVLMETLAGATLEQLLASPDPAPVSAADLADVRTAVAVLHRHGFVHGDIRPSNVLVQRPAPESDGPARAFLLDFDWAGRAGEARYPWALDERLEWPGPVRELRGELITKRHDRVMLRRMFALVREKLKREGVSRSGDGADGVEKQTGIRVEDHDDDEDAEEDEDEGGEETTMLSNPEDNPGEDKSPWSAILTREKVVDFGRAWKARGGVYPANINPNIRWPRPARELRCQPITAAHDRFMLEEMHRLVASACEEADGPKRHEPNADDEDEGEDTYGDEGSDDREAMMSLG